MGNPRRDYVFLVTDPANYPDYRAAHSLYGQVPDDNAVTVIGTCGGGGGVFHPPKKKTICRIHKIIHVHVYFPGRSGICLKSLSMG
ncbi:MAG TPA: hypothetical protein VJ406_00335 [Dehalococcoidia bacterium]|nr:hypothetical protein [Dehalococcoidia bacterium]